MELNAPIESVKGIGPKTAEILRRFGLTTVKDLVYYLPRTYENYQTTAKISELRPGNVVIRGKVDSLRNSSARRRRLTITEGVIRDNTGAVRVVWFNQAYRVHQLLPAKEYYFSGKYDFKNGRYQLTSPQVRQAEEVSSAQAYQPIYSQKGALKPEFFHKTLEKLRAEFAEIPDLFPATTDLVDFINGKTRVLPSFTSLQTTINIEKDLQNSQSYKTDEAPASSDKKSTKTPELANLKTGARAEALYKVHFPENPTDVEQGRKYLAYEELLEFLYAARLNRQDAEQLPAPPLEFKQEVTKKLTQSLPFKLTNAQRVAAWDILQDMAKNRPMNRLLQGDVGSGKTVVAAIAAAQAVANGAQVALLAPTSVLAAQHAASLRRMLEPQGVKVELLVGATKGKAAIKKALKSGEIGLLVGTHAIITDDTEFARLGLCIIDEQHRFGVGQRQKLLEKSRVKETGLAPHLLSMTATPIPRSLQLTLFGDLDVSILNELPAGRQPIRTQILPELMMTDELYPEMRRRLESGEQVYWICAAIEEKEDANGKNAGAGKTSVKKQAKKLAELFSKYRVGVLHGKMRPAEKDAVMTEFSGGKIDLLVSTTVVEVGVDVPNATMIIIQDADHYGLAQLHQLRGRVGRGDKPSCCYLLTAEADGATRRLKELEKSNDGFYLAEVDLKLRGPGEIYGVLQHGALDFKIASLSDTRLMTVATRQVEELMRIEGFERRYPEFAEEVRRYQQLTTLN